MSKTEVFFPDSENVKLFKDLIKQQGIDVCRKVIEKEWINESLSKISFGIVKYRQNAQIGQKIKSKKDNYVIEGFILCRCDTENPFGLWIDLICSTEQSRCGKYLLNKAFSYIAEYTPQIKSIMLYSLYDETLKNWYLAQGFFASKVDIWDGKPKAYLMVKYL